MGYETLYHALQIWCRTLNFWGVLSVIFIPFFYIVGACLLKQLFHSR